MEAKSKDTASELSAKTKPVTTESSGDSNTNNTSKLSKEKETVECTTVVDAKTEQQVTDLSNRIRTALGWSDVHEHEAEYLAKAFHESYERLAPRYGYRTREKSAVEWSCVPEKNKRLMIAVAAELIATSGPLLATTLNLLAEVLIYLEHPENAMPKNSGFKIIPNDKNTLCSFCENKTGVVYGRIDRHISDVSIYEFKFDLWICSDCIIDCLKMIIKTEK